MGTEDDAEDEWNDLWQNEEYIRKRYYRNNRDYYPPNQPQPQPRPQKSNDQRIPRRPWRDDDNDDDQRKRRRNDHDDAEEEDFDDNYFFIFR